MMDIFDAIKTNVPMEAVAEYCGLRPRGGVCLCPFHTDNHPSFKLYPDHGYCFACHTRADAVQLVAYRERLTPLQAARQLASAFGVPGDFNPYVTTLRALQRDQQAEMQKAVDTMRLSLIRMRRTLWQWRLQYAPKNPRELKKPDPRFILAIENLEYLDYLIDECPDDPAQAQEWRRNVKNMQGLYALGDQIKKLQQEEENHANSHRVFFWKR